MSRRLPAELALARELAERAAHMRIVVDPTTDRDRDRRMLLVATYATLRTLGAAIELEGSPAGRALASRLCGLLDEPIVRAARLAAEEAGAAAG